MLRSTLRSLLTMSMLSFLVASGMGNAARTPSAAPVLGPAVMSSARLLAEGRIFHRPPGFARPVIAPGIILTSTNWSGYVAATDFKNPARDSITDVQAHWTISAVNCQNGQSFSSAWVGIDGYSNGTVEQLGTSEDCNGYIPTYYAWWEMYPHPSFPITITVKPGDNFYAEVQSMGGNRYALIMRNETTHERFSITQPLAAGARQSAEWIVEVPAVQGVTEPALSDFGAIAFTNCQTTIRQHTAGINDASWQNAGLEIQDGDEKGGVDDAVTPLSTNGRKFSVIFKEA